MTATPFKTLVQVLDALLGEDGCPWDKKQTPVSLCDYVTEESFELVDAIRANDPAEAKEELGDLLFLLVFIARLYECKGAFSMQDACEAAAEKMVRRHPHVFAETTFKDQEELMAAWEAIKREEKKEGEPQDGPARPKPVFGSLPRGLPPLLKAYRIHSKAARAGFTWKEDADVTEQLGSEWQEFQEALAANDMAKAEEEFGDYLFTLVEYGRRLGFKANAALNLANLKFLGRFTLLEERAHATGKHVAELSLDELNTLWAEVKQGEEA